MRPSVVLRRWILEYSRAVELAHPARVAGVAIPLLCGALALTSPPAFAAKVFALVDTGELYSSTNLGVTWTAVSTLPVRDAVGLAAGASTSELYLASRSGVVYRSTNAGVSWSAVGAIPASDVVDLLIRTDLSLLLLTESGSLYKSIDQGSSWSAVAALTAPDLVSLTVTGQGRLYALARTGGVYESTNGGASWVVKGAITISNGVKVRAIINTLFALNTTGDIFRSADQGATWTPVGTLSQSGMTALTRDGSTLIASTDAGEVATSTDGVSWTWKGVIGQLTVLALAVDTPAQTGIEGPLPRPALHLTLPWPNPARAGQEITVWLTLPEEATVEMALYDLSGRRVMSRPAKRLVEGRHPLAISPHVDASGVYFLRIVTDSGEAAERRLVLID